MPTYSQPDHPEIRHSAEAFAERFHEKFPGTPPEGNLWQGEVGLYLTDIGPERAHAEYIVPHGHDEVAAWETRAVEVAKELHARFIRAERLWLMLDMAAEMGAELAMLRPTEEQLVEIERYAIERGLEHGYRSHGPHDGISGDGMIHVFYIRRNGYTWLDLHLKEPRPAGMAGLLQAVDEAPRFDLGGEA